jgi:hypothetical protein
MVIQTRSISGSIPICVTWLVPDERCYRLIQEKSRTTHLYSTAKSYPEREVTCAFGKGHGSRRGKHCKMQRTVLPLQSSNIKNIALLTKGQSLASCQHFPEVGNNMNIFHERVLQKMAGILEGV